MVAITRAVGLFGHSWEDERIQEKNSMAKLAYSATVGWLGTRPRQNVFVHQHIVLR
jgi:hypothetical protein